jgi:hypothetical protein
LKYDASLLFPQGISSSPYRHSKNKIVIGLVMQEIILMGGEQAFQRPVKLKLISIFDLIGSKANKQSIKKR